MNFSDVLSIRKKMYIKYLLSSSKNNYLNLDKNQKKIIVTLAADYGNLGDVAITYAQTKFLKSNFPEYKIIDFPISKTFTEIKSLKRICTSQDIITIVGGGNTGDLYDDIEYCRQFIIKQFPNNQIISFPQTVDFSETVRGNKALKQAIKVYSKHKHLTLTARERSSLKKYQKYFTKNTAIFQPDIVLYLNEQTPEYDRHGITLCLRSDDEKSIDQSQQDNLIEGLKAKYNINFYDTHINKVCLSITERETELNQIWNAFKKSRVVVTDRLHGMIFCAITKTPCAAIDNTNKKISGVYNAWLKNLHYIKLVEEFDPEVINKNVDYLMSMELNKYDSNNLCSSFGKLIGSHEKHKKIKNSSQSY